MDMSNESTTLEVGSIVRIRGYLTLYKVIAIAKPATGPHWHYHVRAVTARVDSPVYSYTLGELEMI